MSFFGMEYAPDALIDLYKRLPACWSIGSCSPSLRAEWSPEQPYIGQCFVTSLLVQDLFGGEIREIHFADGAIHYYNIVDGRVFDLTSEQFIGKVKSSIYDSGIPTDRAARLSDPIKAERYRAMNTAFLSRENKP